MGALCHECPLNEQRPVAATGPLDAPIVFVGDGPGYVEVVKGEAFQGPSGAKLSVLLYANRVSRTDVYVTNQVACRVEVPGVEGKRRYDFKAYVAWFRKQNQMRKKAGFPLQKSPIECCAPRLKWELDWLEHHAQLRGAPNGVVVVPLANFALAATAQHAGIEGKVGGVMKYRGSPLEPPR
jgi:uracil-DNA glycosylase